MTRRHRTLIAVLTTVAALTGCSLNLDTPPITPVPATPITASLRLTTTAPTSTPLTTSTPPTTGADFVDAGAPTNQTALSNPTFDLAAVDLTSPDQVAWAYLTERLSYSYRDTTPGAGVTRAARYLTPDAATQTPPPATEHPPQDDQWAAAVAAHTIATTTISRLTTFHPDTDTTGAEALVVAEWTRVLTSTTGTPLRHVGNTVLTLRHQADNIWGVSDPGFGAAG